jgi:glycogen synthase
MFNEWGEWTSSAGVTINRQDLLDDVASTTEQMKRYHKSQVALRGIFSSSEVDYLLGTRRGISKDPGERTVAFLSYENPWGHSGGVLAVMRMAPEALKAEDERVIRISPYHSKLKGKLDIDDPLEATSVAICKVPVGDREVPVTVYKCIDRKGNQGEWYLMSAPGYFALNGGYNGTEPYFHNGESAADRDGPNSLLLRDSLFASRAVPYVLRALGHTKNVIIDAQDWQFAPVAQFALEAQLPQGSQGPLLQSAAVALTLHNPYDHGLPRHVLADYTHRLGGDAETVLQRMIPLTAVPVATVSGGFARSLTQSPIQRFSLAPHLQHILESHGVFGITNGSLAQLQEPFSQNGMQRAAVGDFSVITHEKELARQKALLAINNHQKNPELDKVGFLSGGNMSFVGGDITQLDSRVPIIVCYGRFDLGQKGIDVFVDAIRQIPKNIMARYVLISWPGSGDKYVQDHFGAYTQLADERKGEFLFLPARFKEFPELAAGASYIVYPSQYEPFGAVPDALTRGTGVVYHAVDGLLHQLMPAAQKLYIPPGFSAKDVTYAEPHIPVVGYHEGYPEGFDLRNETDSLQRLTDPNERREHRLFQQQSRALKDALMAACHRFSAGDGSAYYRGISELPDLAKSWMNNAGSRQAWYRHAIDG